MPFNNARGSWRIAAAAAGLAVAVAAAAPVRAQVRLDREPLSLTLEAYANLTGVAADDLPRGAAGDDERRVDAALRVLGLYATSGPDLGARVVVEYSTGAAAQVAEASLLVVGARGRLEFGERQGLPDVLLGYAPNNFTFTGAEFGPASGPSLDPGGGLPLAFLDATLGIELRDLAGLGSAATLADDRSAKLLYVSPKRAGWLGGLSYAEDATDPRYAGLLQLGLTHDRYWGDHSLHVGGSYSHAEAARGSSLRDLGSLNVGVTLVLAYDLMLGASVSHDGRSGLPDGGGGGPRGDDAWGAVASVNYNTGPWTIGAFVQHGSREGDPTRRPDDRYEAFEAGASYRLSTRVRLYTAWYAFRFATDGGRDRADRRSGQLLLAGVRATL